MVNCLRVWLTLALALTSTSVASDPFLSDLPNTSGSTPDSTPDVAREPPRLMYGRQLGPVTKDLTSFKPLRFVVNNSTLSLNPATTNLLMNDVLPAVINFFNRALNVHQYLAPIPMWSMNNNCSGVTIPATDVNPGWTGDMMIYLSSSVQPSGFGTQEVCLTDQNLGNPIATGMILNKSWMESAGRNDMFHAVMYLFGQALGFGSGLYQNARKNGYQLYATTEMFKNAVDDFGNPVQVLITPTVASYAKLYFSTTSYNGVAITNRTRTIEWSSRSMMFDIMSSSPVQFKTYFSTISLALFQDLGWYLVDLSMGANPVFGAGDAAFQETPCVSATGNPAFPEFCSASNTTFQCDDSLLFKGNCTTPSYLGGCPVVQDIVGTGSCVNVTNAVLGAELEEWCPECRCFQGTYTLQAAPVPSRPICQRVICSATGAQVSVGGNLISCPMNGGSVVIPGLLGIIQCPPFITLCPTYGCPKDCSGFGKCSQGICQCFTGRYGNDCSNTIGVAVQSITGTTTTCVPNAAYSTTALKCSCNSKYFYDYISQTCLPCNPFCATCITTANICLSCPVGSNSALVGTTGTACICNAGFFRDSGGSCLPCDPKCTSCSTSSTNCQSCQASFLLAANNQCGCPWGTFQNTAVTPVGCKSCPAGCLACQSATLCVYCASTYTLIGGVCQCASGQYVDSTTQTCKPCYSSCLSCSGQANTCTACSTNFVLDSTYKVCVASNFKPQQFPLTNTTWMNFDPSYQFECVQGQSPRDFCKPLAKIGLWYDTLPGYYMFQPNKFSTVPIVLPPAFLFSVFIRPGSNNASRCILGKTRLGTSEAQVLSFCLNPDNTVSLSAKLRSLDLGSLGADTFIKIQTVIQVVIDKWAALKFTFQGGIDYLGRPGTIASILIDQMVYQQTFFPTAVFEDIIDMSDQRFVLGGVWSGGAVQNRFYGYMGEVALLQGSYPTVVNCGCMKCTGFSNVCLSDCGFLYNDTPQNTCVLNQT